MVRGSNPDWRKKWSLLHTCSDRSWGPCSHLYNVYHASFLGVKQLERGVDQPHHHLAPRLRMSRAVHLHVCMACYGKTVGFYFCITFRISWIRMFWQLALQPTELAQEVSFVNSSDIFTRRSSHRPPCGVPAGIFSQQEKITGLYLKEC